MARKKLIKLPGCPSIEDVFSPSDFKKYVLLNDTVEMLGTNGDYQKGAKLSKPILAFQFALKVEDGTIIFDNFEDATRAKITKVIVEIASRLDPLE